MYYSDVAILLLDTKPARGVGQVAGLINSCCDSFMKGIDDFLKDARWNQNVLLLPRLVRNSGDDIG